MANLVWNKSDPSAVDVAREAVARRVFDLLDGCSDLGRIAVFGLNDIGRLALQVIRSAGHEACGFIDSFSDEAACEGLPVLRLADALARLHPATVFLASLTSSDDLARALDQAGFGGRVLRLGPGFSALCPGVLHPCSPRACIDSFRDLHRGETAFAIGNGPSLLRTDPRRLEGRLTFAGNGIHLLKGFQPSYYLAVDQRIDIWGDTVQQLPWKKLLGSHLSDIGGDAIYFPVHFERSDALVVDDIYRDGMETGHSIVYLMLQWAYFMGCARVVLIGCDHEYRRREGHRERNRTVTLSQGKDPDINHFDACYIPASKVKAFKLSAGLEHMDRAYVRARELYSRDGRVIENATAGGRLECFPRVDFETLIRPAHGSPRGRGKP